MRDTAIERSVAALYSPVLPYHNFGHAIEVVRQARAIVTRCAQESVPVRTDIVYLACLFHDAGFHIDHVRMGHASKEAYSAQLAADMLGLYGMAQEDIELVMAAILSTHCDGRCQSNEEKVVKSADLSGVAADYEAFRSVSIRLKKEAEIFAGRELAWDTWARQACERLELFLYEDLHLTSDYFDEDGNSVFHLRARENMRRLLEEREPAPV